MLALGKGWGCFGYHQRDALCRPCRYCRCCPGPSPSGFWFPAAPCPCRSSLPQAEQAPTRLQTEDFSPDRKRGFQGVREISVSGVDQPQTSPPTAHPTAIINLCPSPPCPSPAGRAPPARRCKVLVYRSENCRYLLKVGFLSVFYVLNIYAEGR